MSKKSLQIEDYGDLLTICIPTYNRAGCLAESLSGVIDNFAKYNVSVIVVDNCSVDDTKIVVDTLRKLYGNIQYFCQDENKGYDINFETALRLSKTPYTWVLGDGNVLVSENILPILETLRREAPDAYFVDSAKRAAAIAPRTYTDVNELISDLGWHLTLLSGTIFSRRIVEGAKFEKYRKTNFLHLGVLMDFLATTDHFTAIWGGLDMIYGGLAPKRNTWHPYRVAEVFGRDWTKVIMSLPDTISLEAKKKCIRDHGEVTHLFNVTSLLQQRAVNGLNHSIYRETKDIVQYFAPGKEFDYWAISHLPNCFNEQYKEFKRMGMLSQPKYASTFSGENFKAQIEDKLAFESAQSVDYSGVLTICVPLYNRAMSLIESLDNLIEAVGRYNLKIVLVDNCSTDQTAKIVELYQLKYDKIEYFVQEEQVSFDQNIAKAFELSTTKYTWIIDDSARITYQDVFSILRLLDSESPDLYVINAYNKVLDLPSKEYRDVEQLATDLGWHMSTLASTIYSRQVVEAYGATQYSAQNFLYVAMAFNYCAKGDFLVLWRNLPVVTLSNIVKSDYWFPSRLFQYYGIDWCNTIFALPETIGAEAKRACIVGVAENNKHYYSSQNLKFMRRHGFLNRRVLKRVKSYLPYFIPKREFFIKLLAYTPKKIVKRWM